MTSSRRFSGLLGAGAMLLAGCSSQPPGNQATAGSGNAAAPPPGAGDADVAPVPGNAAAPAPKAALPAGRPWSSGGYALNGTEPFWGGSLTGTEVRYMTPDDQFGEVVEVTAAYSAAQEVYSGSLSGQPFVLTLSAGPCSNGMSDHSYAFTATLQVKGETRRGCADPQ